jgi:hypothetical protein
LKEQSADSTFAVELFLLVRLLLYDCKSKSKARPMAASSPRFPTYPVLWLYGDTREEAIVRVKVLALRVIADEIEHGERSPEAADTTFAFATRLARNQGQARISDA